jgi:hypothetical protein
MPNKQNAQEWLSSRIKKLVADGDAKQLAHLLTTLCSTLDGDTLQAAYQSEIDSENSFDQMKGSASKLASPYEIDPYAILGVEQADDIQTIEQAWIYRNRSPVCYCVSNAGHDNPLR